MSKDKRKNTGIRFTPEPFELALFLTVLTFVGAFLAIWPREGAFSFLLTTWFEGLWSPSLLAFAFQMMLILTLGHLLALSPPAHRGLDSLINRVHSGAQGTWMVATVAILTGFINWGLSLIAGAMLARMVAQRLSQKNIPFNFPLLGTAGYLGLAFWHGGLSGSAPLKAAESGHLASLSGLPGMPDSLPLSNTLFAAPNLLLCALAVLFIPLLMRHWARKAKPTPANVEIPLPANPEQKRRLSTPFLTGLSLAVLGSVLLGMKGWSSFSLNHMNFLLLALALMAYPTTARFFSSAAEAIRSSAGILLQFPLYFGILALVSESGLMPQLTSGLLAIATPTSFPFLTLASAGLVNFFIPSGGGQWAVQGPIILQAAEALGVPLEKALMALAYGDQWTNLLQPFWAIPLLGITGLKVSDVLPWCFRLFLVSGLLFMAILLL